MKNTRSFALAIAALAACTNDVASVHAFDSAEGGDGVAGDDDSATDDGDNDGDADASGGDGDSGAGEPGDDGGSDGSTPGTGDPPGEDDDGDGDGDEGPPPNAAANADGYVIPQNELPLDISAALGVLSNDAGVGLQVVDFDASSQRGAMVTIADDGAVTYDPPDWIYGEDAFSYTLEDATGNTSTAIVRVVVRPTSISLAHVAVGFGGYALDGEGPGDWAGSAVSGGGDIDGDGVLDLVIGAFGATPSGGASGRTYAVHGAVDTNIAFLSSVASGETGFAIDGEAVADLSGEAVAVVGDVNGDGIDDVLVGARGSNASGSGSGRAYLVFGGADASVALADVVAGTGGFAIDAEAPGDMCGFAVANAGDVNGDGLGDLLVGAPDAPGGDEFGRIYVVFGKQDTDAVSLADISAGIGGFAIDGEDDGDRAGLAVAGAGDVDGDGLSDLVIGAPRADPNGASSGRAYVVFGKIDGATVSLLDVTAGQGGFAMDGAASGDRAGCSVDGAGDVDGDGLADVVVGAYAVDGAGFDAGAAYVVFGKADGGSVALGSVADGGGGFAITAVTAQARVGSAVAGVGDLNGDGHDDVVLGAPGAADGGVDSGLGYVVYGKVDGQPVDVSQLWSGDGTAGFVIGGAGAADQAGRAVAFVGDQNGDGLAELLIGAPGDSPNGSSSGRAYVVHGVVTEL